MSDQAMSGGATSDMGDAMPEEAAPQPIQLGPDNFTNRELSFIEFTLRVLAMAEDESVPLMERIKFLAILGSITDEFYMVRVASYLQKHQLGIIKTRPDGFTPSQLIKEIRQRVMTTMNRQRVVMGSLLRQLEHHGVFIRPVVDLQPHEREAVRAYFHEEVFPVLTPLAADHARPFPFISNLSLNIGVYVNRHHGKHQDREPEFVRIKVPEALPRLVNLEQVTRKYGAQPHPHDTFVWIDDVIADNLDLLFPGMTVLQHFPFRITRNADIDYEHEQEDELLDISAVIEEGVRGRRFGQVVRMSVPHDVEEMLVRRLVHELDIDYDRDVYLVKGALGSASLFELMSVNRPELKFPAHVPRLADALPLGMDIFSAIRENDILLYHPYDSFAPVEDFFLAAARDPQVLAVKATLYRVGKNSPIVQSLMEARDAGKQVAVLVELKARFDEENNLEWARAMEHKGVHVTYGVEKLSVKTHAKIALVVRKEGDGLRRYVHLGTGNYNAATARTYTDLAVFTANPEIAEDATRLFNRLTGYAPETTYKRLLVAPEFFLPGFVELIENEIRAARAGRAARLIFKMNQLEEEVIIQKLYEASVAGVRVDLIIRGLCCLRPGIPGVSDNIRVISILGRFLEHSRIYYFQNAPEDQRIYAGSADLMRRNLYNRVETVFPVVDPRLQRRCLRILATDLRSNVATWELLPDGTYQRIVPAEGEPIIDPQTIFMRDSSGLDEMP